MVSSILKIIQQPNKGFYMMIYFNVVLKN